MTQINWQYQVNNRAGGYIVTNTDWNDIAGDLRAFIDQTTGSGTTDNSPLPIGIDLVNDRVYISDPDSDTPEDGNHADTTLSVVGTTTLKGTDGATALAVPDGNVTITDDLDVDGTTNLDNVDIDGTVQIDNTVTVGVNGSGWDVKLFGTTSGVYSLWDEDADEWTFVGADLDMNDAAVIRCGTGDDLLVYANGSNSFVDHDGDGDMWVRALGSGEDLYLEADTDVVIRTGATPAARLTVTQAGNVGIGKTPSVALDVSGTIDSTVNPPAIVETFASTSISSSGTTITFTSSRFASAPNVMITQANSGGGASKVPNVDNISASSCRVFLLDTSNSFVAGDASLLVTLEV